MRYPLVAGIVKISHRPEENGPLKFSPIARRLLAGAPDRLAVLKRFTETFWPMAWTGSRASRAEANLALLDELIDDFDPAVREFVAMERARLAQDAAEERERETAYDKARDEGFE